MKIVMIMKIGKITVILPFSFYIFNVVNKIIMQNK